MQVACWPKSFHANQLTEHEFFPLVQLQAASFWNSDCVPRGETHQQRCFPVSKPWKLGRKLEAWKISIYKPLGKGTWEAARRIVPVDCCVKVQTLSGWRETDNVKQITNRLPCYQQVAVLPGWNPSWQNQVKTKAFECVQRFQVGKSQNFSTSGHTMMSLRLIVVYLQWTGECIRRWAQIRLTFAGGPKPDRCVGLA